MEVKLIRRDGHSALVEWFDGVGLQRGIVPVGKLEGEYIEREELDRAIPYGEPWEELVELRATSEDLARHLRNNGIWTYADLRANPERAQSCLMATYGVDYQVLLRMSRRK